MFRKVLSITVIILFFMLSAAISAKISTNQISNKYSEERVYNCYMDVYKELSSLDGTNIISITATNEKQFYDGKTIVRIDITTVYDSSELPYKHLVSGFWWDGFLIWFYTNITGLIIGLLIYPFKKED